MKNFGSAFKAGSQALLKSVSQETAFEDVAEPAESRFLEYWDSLKNGSSQDLDI